MQEFLSLVTQLGVTGLLGLWLFFERAERLKLQNERNELLERVLKGMNDTAAAMSGTRDGLNVVTGVLSGMRDLLIRGRNDE